MKRVDNKLMKTDIFFITTNSPAHTEPIEPPQVVIAGCNSADRTFRCPPRILANEYVFIFTVSGSGIVQMGDKQGVAKTDDAFLLPPAYPHIYHTLEEPWCIMWFHAVGTWIQKMLLERAQADWIVPTPCGAFSYVSSLMELILQEAAERRRYYEVTVSALAQTVLVQVFRCFQQYQAIKQNGKFEHLNAVLNYIHDHYKEQVNITELAALAYTSNRNFRRIFQQWTGQSPSQYLIQLRISEAKRLLLTTNLSIADICNEVGVSDPSYFSHIFHLRVGESPHYFRRSRILREAETCT